MAVCHNLTSRRKRPVRNVHPFDACFRHSAVNASRGSSAPDNEHPFTGELTINERCETSYKARSVCIVTCNQTILYNSRIYGAYLFSEWVKCIHIRNDTLLEGDRDIESSSPNGLQTFNRLS